MQPEHRFYGKSQPVDRRKYPGRYVELLQPEQALRDLVRFVESVRAVVGCGREPEEETYCKAVTIGGGILGRGQSTVKKVVRARRVSNRERL